MDHDSCGRQERTEGRLRTHRAAGVRVLMLVGLIGTGPASAQNWRITPSIGVVETLTDNVDLAPSDRKRSDLITQVTPGISVNGTGGRVKLNLNYRMNGVLYANSSSNNDIQNYLDATGTVEAVDNWLFVDVRGSITQQAISAFGAQPTAQENINNNRAETSTYRVSPYIVGRLGSVADYQLRYSLTTTSARGTQIGDSDVEDLIASLKGVDLARFGWTLDATNQTISSSGARRDAELTRVRGSLIYQYDPQIRVSALAGWESNDFSAVNNESAATYGASLEWTPTERTLLSGLIEKRTFGNSHEVTFRHRTRLTSWQFTDRKTITTLPEQLALGRTGTAFALLFDALTSRFPDPVVRAQEVERQLQQSGIPRDLPIATTFLTSRVLLQRSRAASVGILGVRNTFTLAAALLESQSIEGAPALDDLSRTSDIEQRSISASWSHRLSGLSSLNLLASHTRSSSASGSSLESKESAARLLFSHQFSPKTTGSLGARYVRFDSATASDYREKAITASLFVTF